MSEFQPKQEVIVKKTGERKTIRDVIIDDDEPVLNMYEMEDGSVYFETELTLPKPEGWNKGFMDIWDQLSGTT